MKDNKEILNLFKKQMAIDYNCSVSDIENKKNIITKAALNKGRRAYEEEGNKFKMLCFNNKLVISAVEEMLPWCEEKLKSRDAKWIFEPAILRGIDNYLNNHGEEIGDVHNYYLPLKNTFDVKPITKVKWYEQEDIKQFEDDDRFGEAFAFEDAYPDVLSVSAIDDEGNIMAMAGASRDSKDLWQIGIDVLPEFRGRGLGTNLVTLLKNEVLNRGKVPYYGTAASHFYSQNVAINAGFYPAWAEVLSQHKE